MSENVERLVFRRDGWQCRHCKNRNGLNRHHVIFRSQQGTDELNNLITLCWQCHRAVHDGHLKVIPGALLQDNIVVRFERVGKWKPT